MGLFSKSSEKDPKEQVNEWCRKIRKEGNVLERQIRSIQREEEKVKRSMKEAAKKGQRDVCVMLAKELIQSRKAITRIHTTKAHLNSVQNQMKCQQSQLKVCGALQKSAEVMKAMQQVIKLPEISRTMQEMSKEMMKAGIIEEMMEDTMDVLEPEDIEEDVQKEVDKILFDVTAGQLGKTPDAVTDTLVDESEAAAVSVEPEDEEEDVDEMRQRLEALRS